MRTQKPSRVPRAVVDANVLVSAWMPARTEKGLREQNQPAAAVLDALAQGRMEMLYSRGISDEYRRVLHPRLLRIPQGEINRKLRGLLEAGRRVEPARAPEEIAQRFQDADDLVYLETALGGQADFIVTSNTCHFSASPVQVVSPRQLPEALRRCLPRESRLGRLLRRLRGLLASRRLQAD